MDDQPVASNAYISITFLQNELLGRPKVIYQVTLNDT
jgi:hypothetical protein